MTDWMDGFLITVTPKPLLSLGSKEEWNMVPSALPDTESQSAQASETPPSSGWGAPSWSPTRAGVSSLLLQES